MANHLALSRLIALPTKRGIFQFDPDAPPPDRGVRAATLRGVLEGLEYTGAFPRFGPIDGDDGQLELGDIVLKFTGTAPFANTAFKGLGLLPLAVAEDKKYFAMTNDDARGALASLIGRYGDADDTLEGLTRSLKDELEKIDGIELYGPADRLSPEVSRPSDGEVATIDISIWPTSLELRRDESRGRERVATILKVLEEEREREPLVRALVADDRNPDRLRVHAQVDDQAFDRVITHPLVEKVRGPIEVQVHPDSLELSATPDEPLLPEGSAIGIVDDLVVESNPWLDTVVVEQRSFPSDDHLGNHTSHGTQVASIAAWGDVAELLEPGFDGQPFPLYVARVAQANDALEAQVYGDAVSQFSAALDWLADNGVRIVVLALGLRYADDGALTSDLSAVVDEKARERGLVIVTSAGNIVHSTVADVAQYPKYLSDPSTRVAAPGTAALSVTTSAVAEHDAVNRSRTPGAIAIARKGEHAPFARTGPVRSTSAGGRLKPEFVAHGGNWAVDKAANQLLSDLPELSVTTLIPPENGRLFGSATGTSMAAPRVAHELARIATRYPDAGPNLLRALLALSGDRVWRTSGPRPPFHSSTYGVPDGNKVLESGDNRVIFTFEGTIETNSHAVLEVPIPEEFARGASERELNVALAFDPPVRRSRKDYIAGRMEFKFVQREGLAEITAAFAKQPTQAELAEQPDRERADAIPGRQMFPTKTAFSADTLVRRTYYSPSDGWDEYDEDYFLVFTHDHSRWTNTQKKRYEDQRFAVAIEIRDYGRPDIDLYALAQARLRDRMRSAGRSGR